MCDSNSIKTVLPIILIDRLLTYILYKLVSALYYGLYEMKRVHLVQI